MGNKVWEGRGCIQLTGELVIRETRLSNSEYTLILFTLLFVIPKLNVL